jgi:transposase
MWLILPIPTIRSICRETGLSRNTIRKYLSSESPPSYTRSKPAALHKLRDHESTLRQWFEFDLKRPGRERRIAQKLYEQLILEGCQGSYSPVCRFIKKLKSSQSSPQQAFIPLQLESGDAMQFD